jgi:hypothetical protein
MVTRTQRLVMGFVLLVWISLIVILGTAPEVYDQALGVTSHRRAAEIAFLLALSLLLSLLGVGVLRRWRWIFWVILVAFLFGLLRVPVAILQLTGRMAAAAPPWYVILQGGVGVIQFAIALVMLIDYRRYGVWGAGRVARRTGE